MYIIHNTDQVWRGARPKVSQERSMDTTGCAEHNHTPHYAVRPPSETRAARTPAGRPRAHTEADAMPAGEETANGRGEHAQRIGPAQLCDASAPFPLRDFRCRDLSSMSAPMPLT